MSDMMSVFRRWFNSPTYLEALVPGSLAAVLLVGVALTLLAVS
jgi:hypothetical protein